MSTSLIVLIPVILLGIVGMLCFVGCTLPTGGLGPDFTTYTTMIVSTKDIIAYWPLKEGADAMPASELVSNSAGNYIDKFTAKTDTVYPWPQFNVPNGANPPVLSAAAAGADEMGDLKLGQPGIVRGDVVPPLSSPLPPACMVVNGCFVEVPFNSGKFIPATAFTVEAWVRVDWTVNDPHAFRFVLDMREHDPVTTGFAILAKADDNGTSYRWAAAVGDGSTKFVPIESPQQTITLKDIAPSATGTTFYLALTFENQTLTLFVDGVQQTQVASGYTPNAAQVLWIGAGTPYSPRRTQPPVGPDPTSPLFPFVGAIQDVAIYQVALPPLTILAHFNNGNGNNG
jgi:hypothetical protein